jgi:hypothetical protein
MKPFSRHLSIPYVGLLSQIQKGKESAAKRPTHGSCALVKEVDNAGLKDLVPD